MNAIAQKKKTKHCLLRPTAQHSKIDSNASPFMAINVKIHDRLARIAMSGHFNFQAHRDFKKSYAPLLGDATVNEIWVEMSKVDYLDISALGMLMLLNERAKAVNKPVALISTCGMVLRALEMANFSKTFNIKHIRPENRALFG
jgi:anti-anti-sigma factor